MVIGTREVQAHGCFQIRNLGRRPIPWAEIAQQQKQTARLSSSSVAKTAASSACAATTGPWVGQEHRRVLAGKPANGVSDLRIARPKYGTRVVQPDAHQIVWRERRKHGAGDQCPAASRPQRNARSAGGQSPAPQSASHRAPNAAASPLSVHRRTTAAPPHRGGKILCRIERAQRRIGRK